MLCIRCAMVTLTAAATGLTSTIVPTLLVRRRGVSSVVMGGALTGKEGYTDVVTLVLKLSTNI